MGQTWFDARQDRLYVVGGAFGPQPTVTVIDTTTNTVIKTFPLVPPQGVPANRCCTSIAANTATGKFYAGYDLESPGIGPGVLAIWDIATGALVQSISIDFPIVGNINTKTNRVYVADNFSALVVVVDGVTNQVIDNIQVGSGVFSRRMLRARPVHHADFRSMGAFRERKDQSYLCQRSR